MRKSLPIFLCALSLLFAAGCSQNTVAEPPASEIPAISIPTPAPEATPLVPMDLFGSECNLFYALRFPETFTVYAATFSFGVPKLGGEPLYVLSMTAEGAPEEAIAFLSTLAESPEPADAEQFAGDFASYGFCEFPLAAGGLCTIRQTDENDDRYQYVSGCHIDLRLAPDAARLPAYLAFAKDNFNTAALSTAALAFDITPVFDEYELAVNLHKRFAEISLRYSVEDAAAAEQQLAPAAGWYDAENARMGSIYGQINLGLVFDHSDGYIYVTEQTSDLENALAAYTAPEVSFATLGFTYYEQDALCIFEDKAQNYSLAIYRPEWGERKGDWNAEILQELNGGLLAIWYSVDAQRLIFQYDKGGASARFDYLIESDEFLNESPDPETVKAVFAEAFGTQEDAVYAQALVELELLLQPRFGLSLQELYALPIR